MTAREVLAAHIRDSLAAGQEPDPIEQWIADLGSPDTAATEPQTDTDIDQGADQ
ncbi:hypothetical protein ABZ793_06030 [Micromonospora sp. NPDC047465]|uniref:hypothetical protein n=1 Tax=Micromonospora sp. NPDC047465 TaxID=3154813 RepID=UPI0034005477